MEGGATPWHLDRTDPHPSPLPEGEGIRLPREHRVQCVEGRRGRVYLAEARWPLEHRHGELALHEALSLADIAYSRLVPGRGDLDLARAAFVDVETTGLAGGTGTCVFLVGIGTFEDGGFRLRQFFLANLSEEAALLAALADVLEGSSAMVSFNGRRFDLPLLETRFTLSRLPPPAVGLPHLDLLYPARRLFRHRLPSCRLGVIEEALLGVRRQDDVPGWAVPGLYFDYLRSRRPEDLAGVFDHNALDILSLVALLAYVGRLTGGEVPDDPADCLALGRWDEAEGRLAQATTMYEAVLQGGACAAQETRSSARQRLARLYRRLGRWDELVGLWRAAAEQQGAVRQRIEALVALAVIEEHRRRDYAAAEALTRRALRLHEVVALGGGWTGMPTQGEALERRLWRLRQRLRTRRVQADEGEGPRKGPFENGHVVELGGFEPPAFCLPDRRSPD